MPKKLTHEFVKAAFDAAGYTMLSEYVNQSAKIDFICPAGHRHQATWGNLGKKFRCGVCAGKTVVTHESVKAAFEAVGYEILDTYVNSRTKIRFRCPVGHTSEVTWDAFKQGVRCGVCNTSKRNEQIRQVALSRRLDHSFVAEQFSLAGYELLSKYIDSGTPIEIRCERGHTHRICWESFKNGNRCGICAKENFKKNHPFKLTHDFVKSQVELINYTMLGDYVNAQAPIKLLCDKGHTYEANWNHIKQGRRCSVCYFQDFYKSYKDKGLSRIVNSIRVELKRQGYSVHWTYFYSVEMIKNISHQIKDFYTKCPQGSAVDHVVPISAFNLLRENELIACWQRVNLRYLDARTNCSRKNKMTSEEIEYMQLNHPEIINAASRLLLTQRQP